MFHIIEDNSDIRGIMVDFVNILGHSALPFASPADYLNYLDSDGYQPPSAIVTDVHMPGMNGYELIDHILPEHPQMKFIVSSGEPQIQDDIKTKVCLFLLKPFRLPDFQAVLGKIKQCEIEGPSLDVGCADVGNFREFGVFRSECPKLCSHCLH